MMTIGTASGILIQDSDTVETAETIPPPSDCYDVEPVTERIPQTLRSEGVTDLLVGLGYGSIMSSLGYV